MAKKIKKVKRPSVTKEKVANMGEDLGIARAQLRAAEEWCKPEVCNRLVAEQQAIIEKAQVTIAEARERHATAPARVKQFKAKIVKLEREIRLALNLKSVNKLETLIEQALKLQEELKSSGADLTELLGGKSLLG